MTHVHGGQGDHDHPHQHPHNHGQPGDDERALEQQNKTHWDERAKDYEFPASTYMTAELAQAIYDRFLSKLASDNLSLLDYACGPGLVAFHLLDQGRVGRIVGADVSTGMVGEFRRRAADKGYDPAQADAVTVTNHGLQENLSGQTFDIVMCNHAYSDMLASHHFKDVQAVTAILASAVKPGGLLIVADFLATEKPFLGSDDDTNEIHKHGVHHVHGFEAETLSTYFEEAGLKNVQADASFRVSKQKLKELGGEESPLKRFLADSETNPDVRYVLVSGQRIL